MRLMIFLILSLLVLGLTTGVSAVVTDCAPGDSCSLDSDNYMQRFFDWIFDQLEGWGHLFSVGMEG